MPYNEAIEARIRKIVSGWENTDSKKMFGWVMVKQQGFGSDEELKTWLNQAKKFVNTLRPK